MSSRNVFKTNKQGNIFTGLTWKGWLVSGVVLLGLLGFGFGQYQGALKARIPVSAEKVQKTIDDHKQVVFYRDSCSSCQQVMPMLMGRNVFKKDTLFVNMNAPENRSLVKKFDVKSVPTVLNESGSLTNATAMEMIDYIKQKTISEI